MTAGLTLCAPVHAIVDLALKLDTSIGNNSNVLRTATQAEPIPQESLPSGSFVKQHTLDASIGIPLGSEDTRLVLTTQLGSNRISAFPDLSHITRDTALQLPWRLGKLWEGNLTRISQKAPYVYDADYRRLDLVTRDTTAALVVLKVSPSLAFPIVATAQTVRHEDLAAHGQSDEDRTRLGAAVRYTTPDGNTLQVGYDKSTSTFPNRTIEQVTLLDDGYRDSSTYVDLLWNYSAKTRLAWRIAARQRNHNKLTERNSHVVSTRLALAYTLSPKTRLDMQLYRQPIDSTTNGTLYSTSQGVTLSGSWAYSPKTLVVLLAQRDSQTDVLAPFVPGARTDNPRFARLGIRVQHSLTRGVSVYLDASRERRTQDQRGPAEQTIVRLGMDYSFENTIGAQIRTRAPTLP